jgi:hypothetical protein
MPAFSGWQGIPRGEARRPPQFIKHKFVSDTMMKQRLIDWEHLANDLALNCETYHNDYYEGKKFSGPSLHFHRRALTATEEEKTEMVYALLVSWGMHRMGGGPQMNEFKIFSASLSEHLPVIQSLSSKTIGNISEPEFNSLERVFENLNAMRSSRKIVAFSKILAHYLPNIIAPVDNEYTLRFIFGRPRIPDAWDEFVLLRDIHFKLIKNVATHEHFLRSATQWLDNSEFPWDTSLPKIVDNLIIGKVIVDKKLII